MLELGSVPVTGQAVEVLIVDGSSDVPYPVLVDVFSIVVSVTTIVDSAVSTPVTVVVSSGPAEDASVSVTTTEVSDVSMMVLTSSDAVLQSQSVSISVNVSV